MWRGLANPGQDHASCQPAAEAPGDGLERLRALARRIGDQRCQPDLGRRLLVAPAVAADDRRVAVADGSRTEAVSAVEPAELAAIDPPELRAERMAEQPGVLEARVRGSEREPPGTEHAQGKRRAAARVGEARLD